MFDSTPWLGSGFLELLALCFLAALAVATLVVWVVDRVHRRAQRGPACRRASWGPVWMLEVDRLLDDSRVLADDGWVLFIRCRGWCRRRVRCRCCRTGTARVADQGGRHRRGEQAGGVR